MPEWLKGVKSKAEAKAKFRDLARQHHPDRGGNVEKMKKINAEWEAAQAHHEFPKTASVSAFVDELFEIYWANMQ
jgi:hypothetical protein